MRSTLACQSLLETLRKPSQDGAAKPKLRSTDTDTTAIANLIDCITNIQQVEAQLRWVSASSRRLERTRLR